MGEYGLDMLGQRWSDQQRQRKQDGSRARFNNSKGVLVGKSNEFKEIYCIPIFNKYSETCYTLTYNIVQRSNG